MLKTVTDLGPRWLQSWARDSTWSSMVTSVVRVLSVFHFWVKLRPRSLILYLVSRWPDDLPESVLLEPEVANSCGSKHVGGGGDEEVRGNDGGREAEARSEPKQGDYREEKQRLQHNPCSVAAFTAPSLRWRKRRGRKRETVEELMSLKYGSPLWNTSKKLKSRDSKKSDLCNDSAVLHL